MKTLFLFIALFISSFGFAQNEFALAENYYRQGEYEKATPIYKKLYTKSPFNTSYLQRLLSCYQESNEFLNAEKILKSRIKRDPSQAYLYVFLGHNYERQQQKEEAKIYYDKALNSLDKDPSYGGIIGNIFREYNSLDNAIIAYKKAIEKSPNSNYSFQIAQIYGEKGDVKKMFESYINMIDENEAFLNTLQRYTSRFITGDSENENNILFRKTLLRKSASKPKKVWNVLLSWLFTQQKEYAKAFTQEKALYQRNPVDVYSIFRLGKIAYTAKDYEAAKQCFDFVNEKAFTKKEKIKANLYLIKTAIATKNPKTEDLFQEVFNKFGKNPLTIKLQVEYADFLTFQKNNPKKATEILEEALTFSNSKFDKARIKLKLGDVLVFRGKYNKALLYFSQIQTQLKNNELSQEARFKVAQTSYFKGDFTWAKAQLKVLKGSTTQLIANDALHLFLKITDNEPVDSIPSGLKQLAKAELFAFQNKDEAAMLEIEHLFKKNTVFANGLAPGEVIYDDVLFFQAKLFIKLKKYEEALTCFSKMITADNQGIYTDDVYYEVAELYKNHLNNTEKALEYYQKIIFEHPSSIFLVDARKKYRALRGDNVE